MKEKESIVAVRCELKIPSLGITVWHHSARTVTLVTEFSIRTSQPLKILICACTVLVGLKYNLLQLKKYPLMPNIHYPTTQ